MNSKNVKDIRKQIRNVVQEQLPEVLKHEAFSNISEEIESKLREVFGARLEAINDSIMAQLKDMDNRSKDVQQFIMNQVTTDIAKNTPTAPTTETSNDSTVLAE